MRARFLLAAGIVAGAVLLAISPAAAQPYPPEEPVLTVSDTTVVDGDVVVITGTGFEPGEDVLITVTTTPLAAPQIGVDEATQEEIAMVPASRSLPETAALPEVALPAAAGDWPFSFVVTADEDGNFTATVKLVKVGIATITATGQESGLSASVVVTVLPDGQKLPKTGSDVWRLVRIGGAGIIIGGILLLGALAWRARRDSVNV